MGLDCGSLRLRLCQDTGAQRRRRSNVPGSPQFWDTRASPGSRSEERPEVLISFQDTLCAQFLPPGVPWAHVDHAGEGQCGVWGSLEDG